MATKKASAKKSTSSRTTATKKTTTKKPAVTKTTAVKTEKTATLSAKKEKSLFPINLPNIILAELLGTFILTLIAATAFAVSPFASTTAGVLGAWLVDPLYVGLTLMVLVMGIGAVSGSHINPAVTFGFWAMRRIKTVMVPVYWLSQFLGALLAVGVLNIMTNGKFIISLANFAQFNVPLLFVELIGTAVFMFGIASVASRVDLSSGSKAWGVGMSLAIALVAGTSMLVLVQKAGYQRFVSSSQELSSVAMDKKETKAVERPLYVNGAVLNPAVALAVREDSSIADRLTNTTNDGAKNESSRFGLEVIIGSLVGAALGGNLYLLVAYRPKN